MRTYAGIAWDRDPSPAGIARQLAGIFASGDRTAELAQIDVPTLVIHGDRDRMVHPTGGAATARAIPGARLETIVGLGHDLPIGAWGRIIDLITDHYQLFATPRARPTPNARRTHEQAAQDDQRPHRRSSPARRRASAGLWRNGFRRTAARWPSPTSTRRG